MAELRDQTFTIRQGAAGSIRISYLAGSVSRKIKKIGKDGMVSIAGSIAVDIRRHAPVDLTVGGGRRRMRQGRAHMRSEVKSGPTKLDSAFIRVGFPAAFVELGHAHVTPSGKTVGRVPPHPFIAPAYRRGIKRIESEFRKRSVGD